MKTRACLAAVFAALTLAACGGDSEGEGEATATPGQPSAANGQELFTQNCANCHTLAAAGANGQVGPNLDDLRPGPDLVRTQTENGGGAMPAFKGRLSPEQIQAIADYVAENAGAS
ncbi:cytochrome c [Solirubrobacter sp. CPCC 204708]|uniref:Cytochrome c n=1 Tax=Solirubrobacter deserti TaxID=2282478 RepID=A0ABT4RV91_9ACTN|nr:cytochrome c [Solirubrobacter deserti]MBE2318925.1 cytochrome c [Solirubrobacter deserti]MDA0142499.1 cytochrome c [Solirubrobacter deserti]